MTPSSTTKQLRTLVGTVVSDKPDKTIVVRVERRRWHPKYRRQYSVTRSFHVHDEKNEFHVGDVVRFVAARPISKMKRWRVIGKETKR